MNNVLIPEEHPLLVVENIIARRGTGLMFTYSRYEVAQPGLQAMAPRSPVLRVSSSEITPSWVIDRFGELGPNEELTWHSWVESEGTTFHIPMIDLAKTRSVPRLGRLSRELVKEMCLIGDFIFFETGRSFHGYFPDLIPERAWSEYLGRLVILNAHNHPPVIDTRWVGHSLVRGFTALRWSHNTNRYQAMPHIVPVRDLPAL